MATPNQESTDEQAQVQRLITSRPLLPEIESVDVTASDDWTGEPSLYLTFHLKSNAVLGDDFIDRFADYSTELTADIIHSGVTRFPYTQLEGAA